MAVRVRDFTSSDKDTWDQFVQSHADGSFFHLSSWKQVIEEGTGNMCPYLLAEENDTLVGVLPLSLRNSLLFGKALISNMFAVYGGGLAASSAVLAELEKEAWKRTYAPSFESRDITNLTGKVAPSWTIPDPKSATFIKELASNAEELLLAIPRKQRAVVRKSLKNGLTCSWDRDLDSFFALYAESVRNLGTPVFPRKYFAKLLEEFGDAVEIQVIRTQEGRGVASLMSFYFGDTVLPYYAGGSPEARKYGAHDYMYYQLMIRAVEKGYKHYDFGRSKIDSGPYKFKKNWGFEPTPLYYRTRVADGHAVPDINPASKKYELMVSMWKKLPLPVANFLGPFLSRHLG